jgi:diguanylate cyclase (GGDEF)-like protein/PAS domain S-box-containing protein
VREFLPRTRDVRNGTDDNGLSRLACLWVTNFLGCEVAPERDELAECVRLGMLQHKQIQRTTASDGLKSRQHFLRILFVHRSPADINRCLHELRRVGFTVNSDLVITPEQFVDRLRSHSFDLVLAEYPSSNWQGTQALDCVRQLRNPVPLIYLIYRKDPETVADLILKGASDCIEMDSISHLPVAIRRAQGEQALRDERNRAEKELGRSEARYRALAGNLNYGICRCGPNGKFMEVNEALVSMLGYTSRGELLAMNLWSDIIQDLAKCKQLFGRSGKGGLTDTIEMDWTRKDGTTLRARLSGQEVISEQGGLTAYELIAEDVTKQRELEDHLRRQAATDPLTGLANYRGLVDVLNMEIKRCERTRRELAVLLFDLDGLKHINDRYGHVTGSRALCRVADVLSFCCRDIDTPARFGGDEFALILPETNSDAANSVARRIRESVANDGEEPKLSISVGAAAYPQSGETIETLLSAADSAMYSMKQQRALSPKSVEAAAGLSRLVAEG